MKEEFIDPGTTLIEFADEVLVVCPQCGNRASIVEQPSGRTSGQEENSFRNMFESRRLTCSTCGRTEDWKGDQVSLGGAVDPWFRHPLWLRTTVQGHVLWAWNARHLDLLEKVVGGRIRKRPQQMHETSTLFEKLPGWLKAANNRDSTQAGIRRLRAKV